VWQARVVGGMVGSLFLRSYERSERVFEAMTARGFNGEVLALSNPSMAARDGVALVTFAALLIVIQAWARL
jgi:cobalt/nickel transport system permease protein